MAEIVETKVDWDLTKDTYFVELLSEECCLARKPVGGLSKDAWLKIVNVFSARYGSLYQRDKLVNRRRVLLEHFKILSYITKSSTGFGWKDQKLSAPENVWNELILKKPQVRGYRDKLFPSFDLLRVIFEGGFAVGRDSMAPIDAASIPLIEGARSSTHTEEEAQSVRVDSSASSDERISQPPPSKRMRSESSSKGSTKKDRGMKKDCEVDAISKLTSAVEKFTESFAEAAKLTTHTPIAEVLVALEATPGISDIEYSRAVTALASDQNLGDAFVALPIHSRSAWLRLVSR